MIRLEFSTTKEFKYFMVLFMRGNEEFIKKEAALLDEGTSKLENAIESQETEKTKGE